MLGQSQRAQAHRHRIWASLPERACSGGGNCSSRRSTGAGPTVVMILPPASASSTSASVQSPALDPVADPSHQIRLAGRSPSMQLGQLAVHLAAKTVLRGTRGTGRAGAGSAPGLRGPRRTDPAARSPRASGGGARVGGDRGAAARGQLAQHRAAQQEGAQLRRHGAQHLGQQIVEDVAVAAAVADAGLAAVDGRFGRARRQAVHRQPESAAQPWVRSSRCWLVADRSNCEPAAAATGPALRRGRSAGRARGTRPARRARAAAPAPAAARSAVDRTTPHCGGSRSSSRSRNSNTAGSRIRCASSTTIRPRAHLAGGQRVEQLAGHGTAVAAAAAGHRHQGLRVGAPGRVERLEGGAQAGEEAERIVAGIDCDPGHRRLAGQARDQPGERRRLAEPCRRGAAAPGACPSAASTSRCSRASRRTRPARGRGAWILVSANEGEAMAACGGRKRYFADRSGPRRRPVQLCCDVAWRRPSRIGR